MVTCCSAKAQTLDHTHLETVVCFYRLQKSHGTSVAPEQKLDQH